MLLCPRAGSPVPLLPGPALLCCLGDEQAALPSTAAGEGRGQLSCSHALGRQVRPDLHSLHTSTWLWEAAQSIDKPLAIGGNCCCRATDQDMALSSSTGQDLTTILGGATGSSHQAVLRYPPVSSCFSSLCPHPSASLSLPSLHHLLPPLSGAQDLWLSRVISGMLSGVLSPTRAV